MSSLETLQEANTAMGTDVDVDSEMIEVNDVTFPRIYRDFHTLVFWQALTALHDRARAEDVAQDVFMRLWKAHVEPMAEPAMRAWLKKTTANLLFDLYRRTRVRVEGHLEYRAGALEEAPDRPSFEERHGPPIVQHVIDRLYASIPSLLPEQQTVVRGVLQGYSLPEIAVQTQANLSTVKSRLRLAKGYLRERLRECFETAEN